ncbi:CaiB/BaiF CoA transferase family protein [Microbacterium sp. RD1]|uniref:CaiB/BaiF CoA transferase family protein n=1 Tax=Microbacterium sp. RD1 TaxID=3457313 RepID=UPI003FA5EFB3
MPAEGPLSDLVVVDLTAMLAGPFLTMVLADLGADVIKVEPPRGDFIRQQGPFTEDDDLRDYGGYFQSVNRNKRSVVLDLKTPEGVEALKDLAAGADCIVENFRNGVMDALGISYETLRAVNPALVYVAVRGFGDERTGESPMQAWPAYDVTVQALSGLMDLTGEADGPPMKVGPGVGDLIPGLFGVVGALAALHRARLSGKGDFVDVAMYDTLLTMLERPIYQHSYTGAVPSRQGNTHPLLNPFDLYPGADGWVSIAAPNEVHWAALCRAMARGDLVTDPRTIDNTSRLANRELVRGAIEEWTSTRTKAEIVEILGGRVPVAPVNTVADVYSDPHVIARGMLAEVEHPGSARPVTIVNSPLRFLSTPRQPLRRAPLLGEHTTSVLRQLGRERTPSAPADTTPGNTSPTTKEMTR